jgi:hypothetical protein
MKPQHTTSPCVNLSHYHELQRNMELHEKRLRNIQPTMQATRVHTSRTNRHIKKQPLVELNRMLTT